MSWAERREVLARDPLAAVDGFRVLTHLMLKHLFGVRICPFVLIATLLWLRALSRPTRQQCRDKRRNFWARRCCLHFLEAQKSTGGQHGHMQVFVQCLHQHTSLAEIFEFSRPRLDALRREYEAYNTHVCHATYAGQSLAGMGARIAAAEASWPSHEHDVTMTQLPDYLLRRAAAADDLEAEATEWRRQYLENDVCPIAASKTASLPPIQ